MVSKVCTLCGVEKPLQDFVKEKRRIDGRSNQCKICVYKRTAESKRDWVLRHKDDPSYIEMKRAASKAWRLKYPEKAKEYTKQWIERNKEHYKKQRHEHNKQNISTLAEPYVKQTILRGGDILSRVDLPTELVEIKRLQLQLKREAKNERNTHNQ